MMNLILSNSIYHLWLILHQIYAFWMGKVRKLHEIIYTEMFKLLLMGIVDIQENSFRGNSRFLLIFSIILFHHLLSRSDMFT